MTTAVVRPVNVSELCEEGDKFFAAGELGRATSFYMTAFSTHVSSTMAHVRKLERSTLDGVIATLEGWLDNKESPPVEGFNKGLVAVFLSTVCPNNLSATIFKMECLLQSGGHSCEEIFARCTALLEGKRNPYPDGSTCLLLEITRALARLFSEPAQGLKLYLNVYHKNKSEMVRLVKSRQSVHLHKILSIYTEQISDTCPSVINDKGQVTQSKTTFGVEDASDMITLLMELLPGNSEVLELQASNLFRAGRYRESAEVYLTILSDNSDNNKTKEAPERRAQLLTGLAAAYFSAGGHVSEACRSLGEAFEIHPACARLQFQKLFTDFGTGTISRSHLRQQADRGLSSFREKVLFRSDLRSTESVELLDPVITLLRTMCHLEADGGGRELRVRLADCLLLRGEHKEALSICSQLAAAKGQQSYQNTVQVLRGYARLLTDDHKGALEDFQAVIEHNTPHPSSCVRALCGRGLLRMMDGFNYLSALDYVTASRLQPRETALTVRCLVPWNCRGLLFTVLLEQGRVMLEGEQASSSSCSTDANQTEKLDQEPKRDQHKEKTPAGVHSLAVLLMDLQQSADGPQILAADALYQLGRVEEAYRMLLSISPSSPRAPILARLAILQLHRGFLYDTNQLLKKLIQCGDTSCLRPLLAVAQQKDCSLLKVHCHSAAKRILDATKEESAVREAVAYLSIAIIVSGGEAADSLLERARCYVLLGQRKIAVFDFSAILKENPKHVQALCGRGFTYLMLNQQKECTRDILSALQINPDMVTKDILSLKDRARKLVCDWLHEYCRTTLMDSLSPQTASCQETQLRDTLKISKALMRTDHRDPRWHLVYIDILLARAEVKPAAAHLSQVFGQEPRDVGALGRVGVVEAWRQNFGSAASSLSKLAEKDPGCLEFTLKLIPLNQRKHLAQAAAQEASRVSSEGHWNHALPLLTVAVQAVSNLQYLRQRSVCLAQLGLHQRAVADLDLVIQKHTAPDSSEDQQVFAEDLCRRGGSLIKCSREGPALEDFSRALELHREWTLRCVEAGLGRVRLAECFLRGALQQYGEQQLSKAWTLIECGLVVDGTNAELRRLRAKVKREVASPCNVN